MSISTSLPPAAPPPKKKGLGCLGCGCLLLAALVLVFAAFIAFILYSGYETTMTLTTPTPPPMPSFTGTDDLYQSARQKLADFDHDVVNHQAATARFSADEINALLSHDPNFSKNRIQSFVSFTNDQARIQASFPTDAVSRGLVPGRYSSFDATFEVHFDQVAREVRLIPQSLQVVDKPILGADTDNAQANQALMRVFTPMLDEGLNTAIRKSPDGAALLDQAKSVEIEGGQLVIETR